MSESEIFLAARTMPAIEREEYVRRACGDNAQLREDVEALLAADVEHTGAFTPDPSMAEPAPAPTEHKGKMIGRYKLIEPIGEGGMGAVWRASQTEPVKREVALKVIKAGMDTEQVLTRFEQERQALAMMDHPNIAKVLDAGQTERGRPFFVMELVKGVPITRYCDDHKLPPRERLDLFVQACHPIQHAHQKGIIHRDVKPSNVLVARYDDRPVVKVIDFGVAKATGGGLTEQTLHTGFGAIVGTLEYMAPEQAEFNALDIDTRSDIYSLGVLLYELLTGSTPLTRQRMKKEGMSEVLRLIREEEPPKPSDRLSTTAELPSVAAVRATEPRRLSQLVRGDLDWIVMKALEKDRGRRYETANGLAMDIQRYLADEPVLAGPPRATYRMRKFIKRNKAAVFGGAFMALVLIAGIVGTTWGLVRSLRAEAAAVQERNEKEEARVAAVASETEANRQKELARSGFEQARQAVDRAFTVVSEDRLLKVPGLQPLRKKLLDEALQYYCAFAKRWANEPSLRRDLALSYFRVASITGDIDSKSQAISDYRESVRLCELLIRDDPSDRRLRQTYATCFNNVGKLLMDQHKYAESLPEFERSLDLQRALVAESRDDSDSAESLAIVQGNLALVLNDLDRRREAFEHLEAALKDRRRRLAANPRDAERQHNLAGLLDTRAGLLTREGKYADAAATFREAIDHERIAVKMQPSVLEYRSFLGKHLFNLALVSENYLDQHEDALAARKDAAAVWEKLVVENPAVTEYRGILASACVDLGNTLQYRLKGKGDPLPWYQRARDLLESLTRDMPEVARNHSSLGAVFDGLAFIQIEAKQFDEARKSLEQAIRHQRRAIELAPNIEQFHRFLAGHLMNLSRTLLRLDQPDRVLATLKEAVPELERVIRERPNDSKKRTDLGSAHHTMGQILKAKGQADEAFQSHRRGISVWQEMVSKWPDEDYGIDALAGAYRQLAEELVEANRPKEAAALREQEAAFWLEVRQKTPMPFRLNVAHAVACLARGELAVDVQDAPVAMRWFEKAKIGFQSASREKPDDLELLNFLARVMKWIGDIHWVMMDAAKAAPAWKESLEIYCTKLLPEKPGDPGRNATAGGLWHNLGNFYGHSKNHSKALECYQAAIVHQKVSFAKSPDKSRPWLNNHYLMLAETLRELKRPDESIAAIRERLKLWPNNAKEMVVAAGELAQCLPLIQKDEAKSKSIAIESVTLIQLAVKNGFTNLGRLKKDTAFDALREQAEFKALLAELEKKSPKP